MFQLFSILCQVSAMTDNRLVTHYSIPENFALNVGMY